MIAMLLVVSQKSGETVLKQLGSSTNQISIMRNRQEAMSATRTHWLPSCSWHQSSSSVYCLSSEMSLAWMNFVGGLIHWLREEHMKSTINGPVKVSKIARTSKWLDFQSYHVPQVEALRQSSEIWHIPLPLELDRYYFTTENTIGLRQSLE